MILENDWKALESDDLRVFNDDLKAKSCLIKQKKK